MKQTIFTFLILSVISLFSCRKDKIQLNIKQYDQQQIENYIAAHALTGMTRDTSGGDTTGMYYQVLTPGTGPAINYSDKVYLVFSLRSFDGSYASLDTIANHYYDYAGHITYARLPVGLQLAVHNILKYPGASIHLLMPSHLAYGRTGYGSGSNQVANNKIPGNACLDYYVHAINLSKIGAYDDQVIQSYIAANSFTGYTKTASGLYYKVLTPGTNTTDPITANSTVTTTYTGQLLNGTIISQYNTAGGTPFLISALVPGVMEGLINYATTDTKISLIIPSSLAYADVAQTGVPAFSCLRYTWQLGSITP